MPFGLKNAGVTYQWLVDKAFNNQVGENIEVYVDNLVIKSHTEAEMQRDIDEMFRTLWKINMKLNPKKCTFGAVEGMFLWYMISPEGIKPCPDKTEVVLRIPSPRIIKEVQSLNGKLASRNRFLSNSAEKSLPLFKTLKKCIKKSDFHWTPEAEQAFKQLKQHLSQLPMLVAPKPKEELIVYMSASHRAISAVLMTERGTVQTPVYFILADFLVEKPNEDLPDTSVVKTPQDTDGSSCIDGSGAGLILTSPKGMEFTYVLRFQFITSNNETEYEALIVELRIASQMGVCNVHAKSLVSGFANFSISQVPRSKNKKADALSKIASTSFAHLSKQVLVEVLKEKSIQEREVVTVVKEYGPTWMTPIMEYLKDRILPDDRNEASKLRIKARQYELLEGVLYRRSFLKLWLRTMVRGGQSHAVGILLANHASGCTGYDMQMQRLSNTSSSDPFPEGLEKVKFFIVAMDYFTKWIEAKAMATISGSQVKKFVLDNIVCRFSLPGEIVSDNVKHPQSNGLVERANRSLGEGIKARLGEGNKNWIKELSHVLWAYRTMIKSSHGDTPFSLTYGTEVVIPVEVGMPTYRTVVVDTVHNGEELRLNLDLLEERRERAAIREAKAKLKMTKYYNARVRGVTFRPGDFVYRSNDASHAVYGGKLGPKWEGPYEVTKALEDRAYRLRSMDGTVLPRTWNIANLKKCCL
ncbi:reverse transcriptase domain-containing protein [Tanacetum coccineum]|uniref:Reverse transcriptase domain-containing protein n=1 Tax=Tanacetum coccineum TaxID=301880 RepID=A0ABQ5DF86_9ASTR